MWPTQTEDKQSYKMFTEGIPVKKTKKHKKAREWDTACDLEETNSCHGSAG